MDIYKNFEKVIETEVLVVGGSGAAVTAAIAAHKSGAKVLLVSKGKVGSSGNAIMAGGGFSIDGESAYNVCGMENANRKIDKEVLFDSIVKESYYISDQNMVEQYVEESPEIVKEYLEWSERAGQKYIFSPSSNSWIAAGLSFTKALRQGLKEYPKINVLEDTMIIEVLENDGKVSGAIGIDIYTGDLILFKSKAVILGTGGFQPCTLKNTVSDMTGDGIGIAYRVGARLSDMEFLLAFATALYPNEAKGSIYPFVMEFNMPDVKFVVRDGKTNLIDIPEDVVRLSRGKKLSKLISMYYYGIPIYEGKGTKNQGVYLDYSINDKAVLERSLDQFFDRFSQWHKHGYYKGDDMSKVREKMLDDGLIEIGIGYEYSMGGILVNENMESDIPGLFAAGEVTSGVFGANRVGDGLTEMLCQGNRSGITAAQYVQKNEEIEIDPYLLEKVVEKILRPFNHKDGISPIGIHHNIEKVCDQGFGIIRTEEGLQNTLDELIRIREEDMKNVSFANNSRSYNYEWIDYLQCENLLICAEAGVRAALMRKESRGCHLRLDYPEVDHDNFMFKILMRDVEGEMKLETRKPIVTKMKLPEGKKDNVIDYFLDKNLDYKR